MLLSAKRLTSQLRIALDGELRGNTITLFHKEIEQLQADIARHDKACLKMLGSSWEQAIIDDLHRVASDIVSRTALPTFAEEDEEAEVTGTEIEAYVVTKEWVSHASSSRERWGRPCWRGRRYIGIVQSAISRT